VKFRLALAAALPLLVVGSGAGASATQPKENGLIAIRGAEGHT
jgi:hypothetical protein